jgi:hypothetical protein
MEKYQKSVYRSLSISQMSNSSLACSTDHAVNLSCVSPFLCQSARQAGFCLFFRRRGPDRKKSRKVATAGLPSLFLSPQGSFFPAVRGRIGIWPGAGRPRQHVAPTALTSQEHASRNAMCSGEGCPVHGERRVSTASSASILTNGRRGSLAH